MTLGLLGVITSLFNITSSLAMWMVAPKSAHASSSLSSLKQENWFAVAMGRDGDVLDAIPLDGKEIGFDDVCSIRKKQP